MGVSFILFGAIFYFSQEEEGKRILNAADIQKITITPAHTKEIANGPPAIEVDFTEHTAKVHVLFHPTDNSLYDWSTDTISLKLKPAQSEKYRQAVETFYMGLLLKVDIQNPEQVVHQNWKIKITTVDGEEIEVFDYKEIYLGVEEWDTFMATTNELLGKAYLRRDITSYPFS